MGSFSGALLGLHVLTGRGGGRRVHSAGRRHNGWGSAGLSRHSGTVTYRGSCSSVAGVDGHTGGGSSARGSTGGRGLGEHRATAQST
jgi:hypothetical protein